ncbi:hypothetical protein JCM33374_g3731 [Metschnikowia sp. JCM 33374]|nr:hypothetical protein JCM33374_g3731 [Metschnikowia sp. JCM 33374]
MNQTTTTTEEDIHLQDKRQVRGRFSWVKRLVQGQNKSLATGIRTPPYEPTVDLKVYGPQSDDNSTRKSIKSVDFASDDESISAQSDNISTTPLKSITSHTSTTNPPSVLSGENHHDNASFVASTTETSLSPSTHVSLSPSIRGQNRESINNSANTRDRERERERERDNRDRDRERERDSESIITLASSTRRVRRRSIDTNCSMAGIPPASIMERLSVHPVAASVDTQDAE